jgi:glycerol-3-phosphate acyltransferase PlsY
VIYTILLGVAAYLIGSVPTGYLLVYMLRGIDVRTVGSKNLGATNVARALGAPWFAVVFTLDFAKGFVPAFWLAGVAVANFGAEPEVGILYGVAAMAGHIWPLYLKFRGGKGVATAAGAVTGISPAAAGLGAIVFVVTLLLGRMVSLGSIVASISLPVAYVIVTGNDGSAVTIAAFVFMMLLVLWKHRTNIGRILKGAEPKVFGRKKETADA